MVKLAIAPNATARFEKKRDAIIAAATKLINQRGVHGMTLKAVAGEVGLITNSVTYYFKRKDDLAVVCFEEGAARIAAMLKEALTAPDPPARVRRFVDISLENERRMRRREAPPLPIFSDVRALPDAQRAKLGPVFSEVFGTARELFRAPGYEWVGSHGRTVRALLLMENFYWAAAWLADYDIEDLARVGDRYFEILANGVAKDGAAWRPPPMTPEDGRPGDRNERARQNYLMAATRLINRKGYRGVSVRNISAELNVTKGAFYHHHDAKSDVIVSCFERTFETMRRFQHAAVAQNPNQWEALCAVAASLVDFQMSSEGPLLRFSALSALPETIREKMVDESNRVSLRFASMIADGVAEGSMRPVDPAIAAQMVNAGLNASAELGAWMVDLDRARAARLFARPMLMGLFTRP